jgi:hypothetical protein
VEDQETVRRGSGGSQKGGQEGDQAPGGGEEWGRDLHPRGSATEYDCMRLNVPWMQLNIPWKRLNVPWMRLNVP